MWVRENEHCFEGTTLIKYVPFLICNFTPSTVFIGILLLLLFLVILFIILGTVADEFFCPNLEVIAKTLNLSEATAGVTVLAFGNGSPDIFTSLAGVPRDHVELIFCELIGGGIFITTVLVGTICITYPLNVVGRILLRDVCFYLASLGWTYYTFSKHYVTIYDTSGYIVIYAVYLLAVISDIYFRRNIVKRASQLIPVSDLERLRRIHGGSREVGGCGCGSKVNNEDLNPKEDDSASKKSVHKKKDEKKRESKDNPKKDEKKRESKDNLQEDEKKRDSKESIKKKSDEGKPGSKESVRKKRDEKKPGSKKSIRKKSDEEKPTDQQNEGGESSPKSKSITFDKNVQYSEGEDKSIKKARRWSDFVQIWKNDTESAKSEVLLVDVEKNTEKLEATQQSLDVKKMLNNCREFFYSCCQSEIEDKKSQPSLDGGKYRKKLTDGKKNPKKSNNCWEFFKCCQNKTEDETIQPLLGEAKPPPKSVCWDFLEAINPIVKEEWEHSSCWFRFVLIIKSPAVLLLKLTVPVVTIHKPMRGWCKPLSTLLCITLPLYVISGYGYANYRITERKFPLIVIILAGGKLFSMIIFCTSRRDKEPPYHIIFAFLGFFGSVFTVYTVANEVVNLMWAVGIVADISEATLGLTVLSWGTQLGDFISILALVRAGYERMGFVACFGGSLFNVIMSIGLAFTVAIFEVPHRRLAVNYGKMGLICLIFLALSLISSLIAFPAMRFRTRRGFGVYLYVLYTLFLCICLLSEFNVIKLPGNGEVKSTRHPRRTRPTTVRTTTEEVVWNFP